MIALKTAQLYEAGYSLAWPYLQKTTYPWEILAEIPSIIRKLGEGLDPARYDSPSPEVWVAKTARVAPTAYIGAPAIIGENTEVRHGAFIRGAALVGNDCVVGNSTELKNVILFDGVQVPHYNYVGDSVLGHKAHLGAGAITSNVKSDRTPVTVKISPVCRDMATDELPIDTGLKKFGAMLGDFVEVGCNSVLNPGSVVGAHTNIYPISSVRGVIPSHSIFKSGQGASLVAKRG